MCMCVFDKRKKGRKGQLQRKKQKQTERERWRDKIGDRVIKAGRELALNGQS